MIYFHVFLVICATSIHSLFFMSINCIVYKFAKPKYYVYKFEQNSKKIVFALYLNLYLINRINVLCMCKYLYRCDCERMNVLICNNAKFIIKKNGKTTFCKLTQSKILNIACAIFSLWKGAK